jgi:hypothetical protein
VSEARTIGPREPRIRDNAFLAFLRQKPCVACGHRPPSDPAHIRMNSEKYGKRSLGGAEKAHDFWCTPLCRRCHDQQHSMSERAFWRQLGKNPFTIAMELYRIFQTTGLSKPTTAKPKSKIKIAQRAEPWPTQRRPIQNRGFPIARSQNSASRQIARRVTGDV